jgi:hypothetical protein
MALSRAGWCGPGCRARPARRLGPGRELVSDGRSSWAPGWAWARGCGAGGRATPVGPRGLPACVNSYYTWISILAGTAISGYTVLHRTPLRRTWIVTSPIIAAILGLTLTMTPATSDVDSYVRPQMAAGHVPGLALGIVKGNQVVRLQAALRWRRHGALTRDRTAPRSLVPAVLHLAWAALVLAMLLLLASAANDTVRALVARVPDLGYLSLVSVAFGVAGGAGARPARIQPVGAGSSEPSRMRA